MAKMVKKAAKPKKRTKAMVKTRKSVRPAKVFIYALALAALGGGGYLVYDRIKRKKFADQNQIPTDSNSDTTLVPNGLPAPNKTSRIVTSGSKSDDNFPLKRGSKGARVTMLQQALAKANQSIQVDGQFGPKTAAALKTAGYPEIVDQALFSKITGTSEGTVQIVFNPGALALSLYRASQSKNLGGVLSVLQQVKSVEDYSSVNEYYKKQGFISKTIVTDLLDYAFKNEQSAKEQIRSEFQRIGLKVDGSGRWSLQGLRLYNDLITIRETVVTDSENNKIPVRRSTILGDEIEIANGMTWFRSVDNSILKVPTQDVKYT
jgi:peptidoglycan hydrolase-like protein with peptidoglycan-binding domain